MIGDVDTNRETLLRLPYRRLMAFCLASKSTLSLCNGTFWRAKVARDFVELGIPTNQADYAKIYRDMYGIMHGGNFMGSRVEKIGNYAIENGYESLLLWVLDGGVGGVGDRLPSFLRKAAANGRLSMVKTLVERLRRVGPLDVSDLSIAARFATMKNHEPIVDYLLEEMKQITSPAEYEDEEKEVFLAAAMGGVLKIVNRFWPKMDDWTRQIALTYAMSNDHRDIVEYIVKRGYLPRYDDLETIVWDAFHRKGSISFFPYLLSLVDLTDDQLVQLLKEGPGVPLGIYIAERLSDELLYANMEKLLRSIVYQDQIEFFRYLVEERRLNLSIDLERLLQSDAKELFFYSIRRTFTEEEIASLMSGWTYLAINNNAETVVQQILESYYHGDPPFDEADLLKEAMTRKATIVALYLLTNSPYVDKTNYEIQYRLLRQVTELLRLEGTDQRIIDRQYTSLLNAMRKYERYGDPYYEEDE